MFNIYQVITTLCFTASLVLSRQEEARKRTIEKVKQQSKMVSAQFIFNKSSQSTEYALVFWQFTRSDAYRFGSPYLCLSCRF